MTLVPYGVTAIVMTATQRPLGRFTHTWRRIVASGW